jgi:acetyl-CoA C-acetyltransferase
MTRSEAEKRNLKPLAQIIDVIAQAREAREIAVVPGQSIAKILERNDLTLDDIKLIEINEAFAAMPLVSLKILAKNDENKYQELKEKTNVNGGAVAIGHPVGASANRITMTLARELARRGGGYGVAAICGGLAQGEAILIKV